MEKYDVIIIGGAAAGLTASLYTARQGLRTLVITKDIGGQALLTNDIQNYPGIMQIGGFELMTKFQEQSASYGAEFKYDEVVSIENKPGEKIISTSTGEYSCTALILAFGKTPRDLGVPGEQKFKGHGVSYCAVCDGPIFKNRVVSVAGVGDHALQAALYLAGVASKVNLILPGNEVRGDDSLVSAVKADDKIVTAAGRKVKSISGDKTVKSIMLQKADGSDAEQVQTDALFVEMGYIARTEFIKGIVNLNKENEIIIDKFGATSAEGIFAAGDVTDVPYKQAVISAGQGSIAALSAYNYIQKLRGKPVSKTDWKSVKTVKQ